MFKSQVVGFARGVMGESFVVVLRPGEAGITFGPAVVVAKKSLDKMLHYNFISTK